MYLTSPSHCYLALQARSMMLHVLGQSAADTNSNLAVIIDTQLHADFTSGVTDGATSILTLAVQAETQDGDQQVFVETTSIQLNAASDPPQTVSHYTGN